LETCAVSSLTSFQTEPVEQFVLEATPLIYEHWQELGLDLDLRGDPDFDKMAMLEKMGLWHVLTVRHDGELIGYLWALVSPHLHYRNSGLMLIVDAYYVKPEYRNGTGLKLLKFMEAFAEEKGAIKIYLTCKVHKDQSRLFTTLGYRLSDYAFTKRIG
jgi:GNAT superfamily N-acetyltransferase